MATTATAMTAQAGRLGRARRAAYATISGMPAKKVSVNQRAARSPSPRVRLEPASIRAWPAITTATPTAASATNARAVRHVRLPPTHRAYPEPGRGTPCNPSGQCHAMLLRPDGDYVSCIDLHIHLWLP